MAITRAFLSGFPEGTQTELLELRHLNIRPCTGCLGCWTKTPGRCVQRDDMDRVYAAIAAADVVVENGASGAKREIIQVDVRIMPDYVLDSVNRFVEVNVDGIARRQHSKALNLHLGCREDVTSSLTGKLAMQHGSADSRSMVDAALVGQ